MLNTVPVEVAWTSVPAILALFVLMCTPPLPPPPFPGTSTAAVATNRQLLRLYTPAGRCGALLSLPGPVVALAARDHLLGVVTAGLPNWANSGQQLHYQVGVCVGRGGGSSMFGG
jgi:hypothetical protein